jgi:hypothetical protein
VTLGSRCTAFKRKPADLQRHVQPALFAPSKYIIAVFYGRFVIGKRLKPVLLHRDPVLWARRICRPRAAHPFWQCTHIHPQQLPRRDNRPHEQQKCYYFPSSCSASRSVFNVRHLRQVPAELSPLLLFTARSNMRKVMLLFVEHHDQDAFKMA